LPIGDRVQLRTVWSIERGMIIVAWDDQDENAYIRDRRQLARTRACTHKSRLSAIVGSAKDLPARCGISDADLKFLRS
jgi:hypothetical protein